MSSGTWQADTVLRGAERAIVLSADRIVAVVLPQGEHVLGGEAAGEASPGDLLAEEAQVLRELIKDGRLAHDLRRHRVCRADVYLPDRKTPELRVVVHLLSTSQTKSPGRHACA